MPNLVKTVYRTSKLSKYQCKVKYDKETDILYIRLSNIAIDESDEDKDGIF